MKWKSEVSLKHLKDLKGYQFSFLKNDILSAISVSLITIPQSIAYAILAGLSPGAGIFSAIFGTIFVGFFGFSKYFIAGPTTAIAILIQTTVADTLFDYFPNAVGLEREVLSLHILCHIVLIMGILQIIFGFFNMGKILQFVSRTVILGYFFGVVIAIIVNQIFPFFGISHSNLSGPVIFKLRYFFMNVQNLHLATLLLGLISLIILIFLRKKYPKVPSPFLMIILISTAAYLLNRYFFQKNHIFSLNDLKITTFPFLHFKMPVLSFKIINIIFPSALVITMLGILETFSVAKTLAIESGDDINYNQQIFSFGITNIILSFFGFSMPASSSMSRTIFNYKSGAKSRLSSIFCGFFILFIITFGWKLIGYIPLVALSAILIAIVPTLLDYKHIKFCFVVTKSDAVVFLLTMLSCLVFSLSIAFFVGIIISIILYLKKAAIPHVVEYAFNTSGRLVIISKKQKKYRRIRIIGIAGELFFANVDLVKNTIQKATKDPYVKVIILRLNNVYHLDASMAFAIMQLHKYLRKTGRYLLISGITQEVGKIFMKASIMKKIGIENLFFTDETNPQLSTWNACMRARELIEG